MYHTGTMRRACGMRIGDMGSSPINGLWLVTATWATCGLDTSVS